MSPVPLFSTDRVSRQPVAVAPLPTRFVNHFVQQNDETNEKIQENVSVNPALASFSSMAPNVAEKQLRNDSALFRNVSQNDSKTRSSLVVIASPEEEKSVHQEHERQNSQDCGSDDGDGESWPELPASQASDRTRNPIRAVVDPIMASHRQRKQSQSSSPLQDPSKSFISLALGDPTTSGNFNPCPILTQQHEELDVSSVFRESAGYVNALGTEKVQQEIAKFHSAWELKHYCHQEDSTTGSPESVLIPKRPVDASHVVVASGCSGALDLVLRALLDPGTFLLVPSPGFPLYQVIAESIGAHVLHYRLLAEKDWEIDLDHVRELVKSKKGQVFAQQHGGGSRATVTDQSRLVRGIVVNNPSNPTGAVYSWKHLNDVVAVCEACRLPIVTDEIYGDMTFLLSRPFLPLANVAAVNAAATSYRLSKDSASNEIGAARVPVITCSGIGKQFFVPGWRVGWAIFHDNVYNSVASIEKGAKQLAQVALGASHPAQIMTSKILSSFLTSDPLMITWQREMRKTLRENANILERTLAQAPGLDVAKAQGAMYVMVRFEPNQFDFTQIANTKPLKDGNGDCFSGAKTASEEWTVRLLEEENVFVLPGSCFNIPNAFRLVFCAPANTLQMATQRIVEFSKRHYIGSESRRK